MNLLLIGRSYNIILRVNYITCPSQWNFFHSLFSFRFLFPNSQSHSNYALSFKDAISFHITIIGSNRNNIPALFCIVAFLSLPAVLGGRSFLYPIAMCNVHTRIWGCIYCSFLINIVPTCMYIQ